ncbi:hypothetical protein PoB_000056900 [Plakobranchus ocellatus]|uniref:Uncharacterized protein n=1 Tax=Plakobranchus ocellatus TaxID=259542 RepID=A0AAV3XWC8_9GAST|nr:hypothetical protein PoB_000056900 [Plakobranchus ocellatus]
MKETCDFAKTIFHGRQEDRKLSEKPFCRRWPYNEKKKQKQKIKQKADRETTFCGCKPYKRSDQMEQTEMQLVQPCGAQKTSKGVTGARQGGGKAEGIERYKAKHDSVYTKKKTT